MSARGAGGVDVLARQRQAQLDAILRLEVAARQVVDARERHEGHLAGLDARVQRGLQRGHQRPVGVERERRVGAAPGRAIAMLGRDSA